MPPKLQNPWHIHDTFGRDIIGEGGDPYDSYKKNPGTRCRLKAHPQFTKKGLLEREFVFPAPPLDQLVRTLTQNFTDYDTVSAGQFSRPGSMQLQTISWDTIIVADDYPWAFYNPLRSRSWDASETVRQIGNILRAASVFWLIIEEPRFKPTTKGSTAAEVSYDFGSSPLLKMMATLRALTATSKAGEPDAWYVNVSFTEHRSAALLGKALGGKGGPGSAHLPASLPLRSFQKTPKPKQNTLHDLAVFYYGSAAQWKSIKDDNKWLGNITATHDLGVWNTNALKTAGKANRRIVLPVHAQGGHHQSSGRK